MTIMAPVSDPQRPERCVYNFLVGLLDNVLHVLTWQDFSNSESIGDRCQAGCRTTHGWIEYMQYNVCVVIFL